MKNLEKIIYIGGLYSYTYIFAWCNSRNRSVNNNNGENFRLKYLKYLKTAKLWWKKLANCKRQKCSSRRTILAWWGSSSSSYWFCDSGISLFSTGIFFVSFMHLWHKENVAMLVHKIWQFTNGFSRFFGLLSIAPF